MNLKNYTSGVPTEKTVARIESILAETGAKAIGKNYEAGKLASITFQMEINGRDFLIRLPSNPQAVYDSLRETIKRPRPGTLDNLMEQSRRTAWKIQQDWLEIELTQINLNQKEPLQVFLAYVWDGNQTFYQRISDNGFKQLAAPKPE